MNFMIALAAFAARTAKDAATKFDRTAMMNRYVDLMEGVVLGGRGV